MASDSTVPSPRPSAAGAAMLGIEIGLVLALVTSVAESAASLFLTARTTGFQWPLRLAAPLLGQALATHALVWAPLGALIALALRGRAAGRAGLVAPVCAALVLALAVVVVPADLALATKGVRRLFVAGAVGAGAVVAGLAFLGLRAAARRGVGVDRAFRTGAVAAAVVGAVTFVALLRSPLFDPGAYRVPAGKPGASAADPDGPPNVLWIVLDTARADRMSVQSPDPPTTPFLAEWAGRSIVCDQAVSNGIWTGATHASMFTGLAVRDHGLTFAHPWLDEERTTVAEALSDRGFDTATFSNNPVVSPATNLTQGFRELHAVDRLLPMTRFSLEYLVEHRGWVPPLPWLDPDFGAAMTNWMIARWLDDRAGSREPAFVFVNLMEAHAPYTVPASYRRRFLPEGTLRRSYELREKAYGDLPKVLNTRFNMEGGSFLPESDREILRAQYDAAIRYLDDRVRELVGLFEQRGLLDHTVVVICSDHGEYLDDHGLWGHEFLTYNELSRVLLMFREPGRTEPLRIDTPVPASDLHDAVLAAALGEPGGLAAASPETRADRVALTEFTGPWPRRVKKIEELDDDRLRHLASPQVAVQDRDYKLMVSDDGTRELYEVAAGPETVNRVDELPGPRDRLAELVEAWKRAGPRTTAEAAPAMDADTRKRLEALGYLGN